MQKQKRELKRRPRDTAAVVVGVLALSLGLQSCGSHTEKPQLHPGVAKKSFDTYRGIPEGSNYPLPEETLLGYRDRQEKSKIREHVWAVYTALTSATADGIPVWKTWCSAEDVLRGRTTCDTPPETLGQPTQFQVGFSLGDNASFRKDRGTAGAKGYVSRRMGCDAIQPPPALEPSVVYNRETRDHILDRQLWRAKTLNDLNDGFTPTPISQRNIPGFPAKSVALKLFWIYLSDKECQEVGIWKPDPHLHADIPHYPGENGMGSVFVDGCVDQPDGSGAPTCTDGKPAPGHISMSSFYHVELTSSDKRFLQSQFPALSARFSENTQFFKILVGFHVTTKEIPDWVWATFWWHPQEIDDASRDYAEGRPQGLVGPWENYLMDATLSMETPHVDGTQLPKRCFSPYFEATKRGGIASNCMRCHRQAAYPRGCTCTHTGELWGGDERWFKDTMKTDFLWSVAIGRGDGVDRAFVNKCPDGPCISDLRNTLRPLTK